MSGSIFAIESGGLRKLATGAVRLQTMHAYYMGASASPDLVIVTAVSDEWVTLSRWPWRAGQRVQRPIADDLIAQGTRTWLRSRDIRAMGVVSRDEPSYVREWVVKTAPMAEALEALLAGEESSLRHDPVAWQRVKATCREGVVAEDVDPWSVAETYGSVGSRGKGAETRYEVVMPREGLDALRSDPRFVVESVEEDVR